MQSLNEVLEAARRLSAQEQERLIEELITQNENAVAQDRKATSRPEGPYARTLAAAGSAHSDFTDLASNTYEHVAAAAAHGRDGAE
jgi:hypothetical protein